MATVRSYDDGQAFWRDAAEPLGAFAVPNNVLIGIAYQNRRYDAPELLRAAVFDGAAPILTATQSPPYQMVLADLGRGDDAVGELARYLHERGREIPGVTADRRLAEPFAREWCALTGVRALSQSRHGWEQNLYQVEGVVFPKDVPGRMRAADMSESPLINRWQLAFGVDADLPAFERDPAHIAPLVEGGLREGSYYVWEADGEPVAMARRRPIARIGVRVGAVYTPDDRRGRGYAAMLTAALSQAVLAEGLFCCLFADAANPLTNRIYQRIGYKKLATFADISFAQQ